MAMPAFSSLSLALSFSSAGAMLTRVVPPPATRPSSTAARVALRASSKRCFFSLS
jgi:hypothetical protein